VENEDQILAKLNNPIFIVHGKEDKAVPLENSKNLNKLWPGSTMVVFENAGHTPQEAVPGKI